MLTGGCLRVALVRVRRHSDERRGSATALPTPWPDGRAVLGAWRCTGGDGRYRPGRGRASAALRCAGLPLWGGAARAVGARAAAEGAWAGGASAAAGGEVGPPGPARRPARA